MRDIPKHAFPMEYRSLLCFRDLSVQQVRRVWGLGQQVHIPRNWSLIIDSGAEESVYLVLSGLMQVTDVDGTAERGSGSPIGDLDFDHHRFRQAVMTATTDVEALMFTAADFRVACDEVGPFGESMRASRASAPAPAPAPPST